MLAGGTRRVKVEHSLLSFGKTRSLFNNLLSRARSKKRSKDATICEEALHSAAELARLGGFDLP